MPLTPGTIDTLARTPAVLESLLNGLPDATLTTPDAEGWSARDVVAHLRIINRLGLRERLELMLRDAPGPGGPFLPDVNEHQSLAASGYRDLPTLELLTAFAAERAATVAWLRGLDEADLARSGRHEFAGPVTATHLLHHMAFHDLMHVAQAANLVAAPLSAARGPMGSVGSAEA